jgi:polysaccharide biosynthesis protein PslH
VAAVAPPPALRKLASRWPSGAEERRSAPYRRALEAALRDGPWDVAVIDSLPMCWTLPALREVRLPVVYTSHNYETALRREFANQLIWRDPTKLPLLLDARRIRLAERMLVAHSSLVTAVTESDADRFRSDGARNVLVAAPGYSGVVTGNRTIDAETPRVAVMVESLLWRVKRANVRRLVKAADPVLARAGIELRIVGITPPSFSERDFGQLDASRFTGRVDSIDDQLAEARVGVISERDGGGFKLKALDYVFHRVPMVILDGSVDGLPLRPGVDYADAASEEILARKLVELVDNPAECQRMQRSAFDRCAGRFDWSSRGSDLAVALDEIVTTGARRAR